MILGMIWMPRYDGDMIKREEEKWTKFFSKAFAGVVLPSFEDLHSQIEEINQKMATKQDIDRLERKCTATQDRLERHDKTITKLEQRVYKN